MSANNDGGPVKLGIPHEILVGPKVLRASDMSLRAYFAGQILPEAMRSLTPQECAEVCVDYADELIAMLAAEEARK